jgi:hypothetical protein
MRVLHVPIQIVTIAQIATANHAKIIIIYMGIHVQGAPILA